MRRAVFWGVFFSFTFALGSGMVQGQAKYPERAVEMVIPWGTGGTSDITGRIFGNELSKVLKVPVTPVNKAGGGSVVGQTYVFNARKDGYTTMYTSVGCPIGAALVEGVPFDFGRDFVPLTILCSTPYVLFVKTDSPYKSFDDLIDKAKKSPKSISVGCVTAGDAYFNLKILEKAAGVEFTIVPMKSGGETPPAILGGHVDVGMGIYTPPLPFVRAGQMRFLAITGSKRLKEFPNVPTIREKGYKHTFLDTNWNGLFVARGVPQNAMDTLISASERTLHSKEMIDALEKVGNEMESMSTSDFRKRVEAENKVILSITNELGLKGKQ
jgi:tripartite-type tricarboxylate transporter receptor subunit TctC